eukprot:CAMPEP_0117057702 /NCGR_PEP_ID=MMETSP0472-20121206/40079_1 /TAXON_ID=693140 ORGANISM="Tiarina fusus, Strain LIS" /NCGR_SAMPLE_ID=MMETSP0472 /ASSEMBLY_ACC=CAM_ASM_000603 /LENGTH=164 /DNA_ID=CAMNT_0004774729 /DNA_START=61 /DNA_END=556 /DNA_ORIENTATION=-
MPLAMRGDRLIRLPIRQPDTALPTDTQQGRGEGIRIALHAAGVEFEDKEWSHPEWKEFKESTDKSVCNGGLPVLTVDRKKFTVFGHSALCWPQGQNVLQRPSGGNADRRGDRHIPGHYGFSLWQRLWMLRTGDFSFVPSDYADAWPLLVKIEQAVPQHAAYKAW